MSYAVTYTSHASRQLSKIDRANAERIRAAISGLAAQPRPAGCQALAGQTNQWRIRVGNYRVIYEIHDHELLILVVEIGHRREVYRNRR